MQFKLWGITHIIKDERWKKFLEHLEIFKRNRKWLSLNDKVRTNNAPLLDMFN